MVKALRITAWTAVAALAAALALAAAAKLYFTQDKLKSLTAEYAARNLRRQVSFDSVSLKLSGLSITNLRVSEYPDFRKGEFFSAASFSARPSLRSLLRRELKIDSISADGLRMRVTELKRDLYNFSDLLAAPPAPARRAAPAPRAAAPAPFTISSLKVRNSRFTYNNAAGDLEVTLRDINLSASGISPSGLFPVEGDFTLQVRSPYFKGEIPAGVKGKLALGGFDPEKGRAEIARASLSLGKVKAEITGKLSNLLEPDAKLRLAVTQFSTADLRAVFKDLPPKILLPEIDADADFKLTARDVRLRSVALKAGPVKVLLKGRAAWDPAVSYDLSADVKAQVPEIDTTLLARKARQYPVPRGLKLPLTEVSASVKLKDGRADILSFKLESAPFTASGASRVNFSGPRLSASGSLNARIKNFSRLAEIAPALLARYSLSGEANASLEFAYSGAPSLKGKAGLKNVGASFAGRKLTGLSGDIAFTGDSASAGNLRGKLDGEAFSASFGVVDALKHPKADFTLDLARLVLPDFPASSPAGKRAAAKKPAGKPFYIDLKGSARLGAVDQPNFKCGAVSARLALTNISGDMRALDGSASFSAGPGKFAGLYKLASAHKAAKVALYPLLVLQKASKAAKALRLPDFDNIDFTLIEGDYSFNNGVMKLEKSAMTAPAADVSSTGSINLPAEKLNMRIETKLKAASGVRMSAPVALLVKGTFDDPAVTPDIKSITEQPAVKKAVEKLAPKAEQLLRGLFKK